MKYFLLSLLTILSITLCGQTYTVQSVPNTKLVNNSYVSNPDNIISGITVSQIDSILSALEASATAQVAVVLVNSIGENDVFDFSLELFNYWGIGQKANDNGLLILMVLDQRKVWFSTGDGIEGLMPDALCKEIQREKMVPYFKEGNYDMAMLEGVKEVARVLNNPESRADAGEVQPVADEETHLGSFTFWIISTWMIVCLISFFVKKKQKKFADLRQDPPQIPKGQFTASLWFLWFLVLPLLLMIALTLTNHAGFFFGGLYAYAGATLVLRKKLMDSHAAKWLVKKDFQGLYNYYQDNQTTYRIFRFLFPLPLAFMYGAYKKKMLFFRNHPRNCKQCEKQLMKLDEQADDKYLSKGQIAEEGLKSVDYDVWLCQDCQSNENYVYRNPATKYSACSKCSFIALHLSSSRTLRSATEYNTGLREEVKICKFCGHREVKQYTIPKVTKSSSSSGSSSSGGSWGGGRSSGGGAGSSW